MSFVDEVTITATESVRVRWKVDTRARLTANESAAILDAILDLSAIGVVLTDRRFGPMRSDQEGLAAQFRPTLTVSYGFRATTDLVEVVREALMTVDSVRYQNPWDVVLQIGIGAISGGGLVGFLSWLNLRGPTRDTAIAEADRAAATAHTATVEAELARRHSELSLAERSAAIERVRAEARKVNAEAAELELAAIARSVETARLLAEYSNFDDRPDYLGPIPPWTADDVAKLLDKSRYLAAAQLLPLLRPEVSLEE